jgi:peptide-methionine (S)-S-oxide reductase
VIRTRVGYAGGTLPNPSYYNLGNHSETIQIDYDPSRITYQDLLAVFWESHSPQYPAYSQQYASIIFYHDDEQRKTAEDSLEQEQLRLQVPVYTVIRPFENFTLAEDYHQKYYLQGDRDLFGEMSKIYPEMQSLIGSTAAARINGYLGGNGSLLSLQQGITALGLSEWGRNKLLQLGSTLLRVSGGNFCPVIQ